MKILVAGANGQVARSLNELEAKSRHEIRCLGRPEFDISDKDSVSRVFAENEFDLLINAAAYTAVDAAESDEEAAFATNGIGVGILARATERLKRPIFHISTDYVFDGTADDPYLEDMPVCPLGVYGKSKLDGEVSLRQENPKHLILRTAWVYSPFGKNFVKTMLRLAEDRDEVSIVADQIGSPTYAVDIARTLLALADELDRTGADDFKWGTYHLACSDHGSWADVAEEVFAASKMLGGPTASVRRITSAEYPTPVTRPANSRLDTNKLQQTFDIRLPNWRDSVKACVERLIT